MERKCEECEFSYPEIMDKDLEEIYGTDCFVECRFNPPTQIDENGIRRFPLMFLDDYCNKWKENEDYTAKRKIVSLLRENGPLTYEEMSWYKLDYSLGFLRDILAKFAWSDEYKEGVFICDDGTGKWNIRTETNEEVT